MTTTNFKDWLDQIDFSDYNTVYGLYQTIETLESYGSFDIEQARGSSDRWIVSTYDTDEQLLISGQKAREYILSIIDHDYTEDMGIEGFYAYHHAMEKDD